MSDPLKGLPQKEKIFRIKEILEGEGWYNVKGRSKISRNERLRIINIVANHRGGKCLSTKYVNNSTKMKFECGEGHQWKAISSNIINNGRWCPNCANRVPYTIRKLRNELKELGFKLLERKIKTGGTRPKYHIECQKCGYKWDAFVGNIIYHNEGCPKCYGNVPHTIEWLRKGFRKHKVKLLEEYVKEGITKAKYLVRCLICEYEWYVKASNVINNHTGCPNCAGNAFLTIEICQQTAKILGGKCLSTEYVNNTTKLQWECAKGHIFELSMNKIRYRGRWCPDCPHRTETIIRLMIEWMTGHKFPHYSRYRLEDMGIYLINTKGNCMELDGYCPSFVFLAKYPRGMAFEYHGDYHTNGDSYIYDMRQDFDAFERRKEDDRLKREQCEEQGIKLIEVWGNDDIVYPNFSKIYDELVSVLKENSIETDRPNMSDTEWMLKIYPPKSDAKQTTLL